MGDQIVEEWEDINMIPVETGKEEQMVKKTRKVPDEKVTQQENNSLTWWEITRPQVRDMIIRQKIEERRRVYENVVKKRRRNIQVSRFSRKM